MIDNYKNINPLYFGQELTEKLKSLPDYEYKNQLSTAERLLALSRLYEVFWPSKIAIEIYHKLYQALVRSLEKKSDILAVRQQNSNRRAMHGKPFESIIGGDSFSIIGESGTGKSATISRATKIICPDNLIEPTEGYQKIISFLVVQTPFDCSVKQLLLDILRRIDEEIGTDYFSSAYRPTTTTDMLIGAVSNAASLHVAVLVVDEVQNIITAKYGRNLIGALTQIINSSGISVCMVGTPVVIPFFEQEFFMARRALGIRLSPLQLDNYFYEVCAILFNYQFVLNKEPLTEEVVRFLYEKSGGVIAVLITILHDAQEIAIINGQEVLNTGTINEAYIRRLGLLHSYATDNKRQSNSEKTMVTLPKPNESIFTDSNLFMSVITEWKTSKIDVLSTLKKTIVVEEI